MVCATDSLPVIENDISFQPRTMAARPELIRSTWYVIFGGWLALALATAVNGQNWTVEGTICGVTVTIVAPLVLCLYVHTNRLVIDERGLACRHFWFWQGWPWEDFAAGKVSWDKTSQLFINRAQPLSNRWLSPMLLLDNDADFVLELVRSFAGGEPSLQDARQVAVEMELAWRVFFKLRVDRAGCGFVKGEAWHWSEIAEFRLEQDEVQRRDVYYLVIVTRAGERRRGVVAFHAARNDSNESIRNTGDEWLEQLRGLVPAECWKLLRMSGDLTSREEGEYRLRKLAQQRRALWWIGVLTVAVSIVFAAVCIIPGLVRWWSVPFLGIGWKLLMTGIALTMVLHAPLIVIGIAWESRRTLPVREAQLRRQMSELSGSMVNQSLPTAVHAA